MSAKKRTGWVRSSAPPDEIRVSSFVVRKDEYPELVQWLWSLPYRRTSTEVRDILNEAARRVSSKSRRGGTSTTSAVPQETAPPSAAVPNHHEAVAQTPVTTRVADVKPSVVPAHERPSELPSSPQTPAPEMTAEVADLMRSYGRDF